MSTRIQALFVVPCFVGAILTLAWSLAYLTVMLPGMPLHIRMTPLFHVVGVMVLVSGFLFLVWVFAWRNPLDIATSTYLTLLKSFKGIRSEPAAPRPEPLILQGPQRHVRHPMYFAVVALFLGWWLTVDDTVLAFMAFYLFLWFNLVVIPFEEKELLLIYGAEYEAYAKGVPRFIPLLEPPRRRSS